MIEFVATLILSCIGGWVLGHLIATLLEADSLYIPVITPTWNWIRGRIQRILDLANIR